MPPSPTASIPQDRLTRLLSAERLSTYLAACEDRFDDAIGLYRWNALVSAAFWEPIGHLEVALRNTLSDRLLVRHARLGCAGSWLVDPRRELGARARADIAAARARVRRKGKRASEAQTISELSFGFWRFLITRKLTALWPDLASGFPNAPDRRRETVEVPLERLHDFRNRIAHHQRIWNHDLGSRYRELLALAGYVDSDLARWIAGNGEIERMLANRPPGAHLDQASRKRQSRAVRGPMI